MRAVVRTLVRIAVAIVVLAAIGIAGLAGYRWLHNDRDVMAADAPSSPELVKRGEYLAHAADCVACHQVPGGKPYAGGTPFKLPFGVIYSTNITPDKETGIGTWSDDDFVRALHHGVRKDGSHLYPAFPYTSYTRMSRDDAVAIKAYLFSLEPVHAPAKKNELSFPFNQRWAMAFWNMAFLDARRFRDDPDRKPEQNRGDYVANALGHCGECHTPRNFAFALDDSKEFAGADIQGWRAYNITSDKTFGVGAWTDQQLSDYFAKGHAEGRAAASGPMAEAVEYSTRHLTEGDRNALISYLRIVKAQPGPAGTDIAPDPESLKKSTAWAPPPDAAKGDLGRKIFEGACASCHQYNGKGQQTPYAGLAGLRSVNDPDGVNLTMALLQGSDLKEINSGAWMPSFAAYSDVELAAVANYVIGHFSGKQGQVTPEKVAERRKQQ
ncbi:c-type cytochrome [Hansschlegelia beijingensis]